MTRTGYQPLTLLLFAAAVAGCGGSQGTAPTSVAVSAPAPVRASPPPLPPLPEPCTFSVGERQAVAAPGIINADVGANAESALFAYQVQAAPRSQVIRARLLLGSALGSELLLSGEAGFHVLPHVFALPDRFLVAWNHQLAVAGEESDRDEVAEARWVFPDKTMSAVSELPFGSGSIHLARVPSGIAAMYTTWESSGAGTARDVLMRQVLDLSLRPIGPPVALLDAPHGGDDVDEVTLADGTTWVVAVSSGFKTSQWRAHLIHLDAAGRVVSAVKELPMEQGYVARPALLDVGDGLLVTWLGEQEVGQPPVAATVTKLSYSAEVLEGPRIVGSGGTRFNGGALVVSGGAPALLFDGSQIVGLDRAGAPRGAPQRLGPTSAQQPFWIEREGSFALAWLDGVEREVSLQVAPVTCTRAR